MATAQWLKVFTSSNIIFIYLQIIDFILRAFYNKIELSEITDANFLPSSESFSKKHTFRICCIEPN